MKIRNIEAEPVPVSWEQFVQQDGFLSGRNIADLARHDVPTALQVVTDYARQIPERARPTTLNGLLGLVDWARPEDRQQFLDGVTILQNQGKPTLPSPR